MPEYQTFLDGERLKQFWDWTKFFIFYVSPVIMIGVALEVLGGVITMIKTSIFGEAEKDDDDDYEVRRY